MMVGQTGTRVSIIIPVFNEENRIKTYFRIWQDWIRLEGVECIFVDGGSQDQSVSVLQQAGFTVVVSDRGRATQMNFGASVVTGDILLFVHADTDIDNIAGSLQLLITRFDSCKSQDTFWGFHHLLIETSACSIYQKMMLTIISRMINLRSTLTHVSTGDQAQFISRSLFTRVDGFPKLPLLEDVQLCKNLRAISPPVVLTSFVTTSSRRWLKKGIWGTIVLMWKIRFQYWRGESAHSLASSYKSVR